MTFFWRIIFGVSLLLAPYLTTAQHHWLKPEPALAVKKMPVRLSLLYGDSLLPQPGSAVPSITKFTMYQGKDSFSLQEIAAGSNVMVRGELVKESFIAGASLKLPDKTLRLSEFQKQLTKEQKAILALKDTSVWQNGVISEQHHYVKALVTAEGDKGKTKIHGKQFNHDLEILLNTNPASIKTGDRVVLQVLLHQRVLPNHKLSIWRQETDGKIFISGIKTNRYGVQVLTLPKAGNYVVLVSQEGPHKKGLTDEVQWKSLQATYYFSVE